MSPHEAALPAAGPLAARSQVHSQPRSRPRSRVRSWLTAALLLAAFALALGLRLQQAANPIVFDEYASMFFSRRRWSELWGWWMLRETNPPLFYSLLKVWRALVPQTQGWLRLLPLLISLAQIALLARLAGRAYGGFAAVLCVLLFALGPSDIYQSEYLRGYVLAKLAVTASFAGLLHALKGTATARRGWIAYGAGALLAIYSHTTMLLWPPVATLAVLVEWGIGHFAGRRITRGQIGALLLVDVAIAVLSGWVLLMALMQLRANAGDISWIEPLSWADYASSIDLQLFLDAPLSSGLMAALILLGLLRTWRSPTTRMALVITLATLGAYKLADHVHPIVSDYTMHWCATFTVLLAGAALADGRRRGPIRTGIETALALAILALVAWAGWSEFYDDVWMPQPQDLRRTIRTVAATPAGALLASHESDGVVIEQACRIEFGGSTCPFPFVVLANPAKSDSWATGGFGDAITPPARARAMLGHARTVYAFSRYLYTPLVQLGMDERRYHRVQWDDGELIGPIPIADFPQSGPARP